MNKKPTYEDLEKQVTTLEKIIQNIKQDRDEILARAAAECKRANDAACVATQNMQSLFNNAKGFFIYQAVPDETYPYGARVLLVSPSITDVSGITDIYNFDTWFENIHPDDRQRIIEANQHAIETHETFDEVIHWHHRLRNEWIWLRFISTPVYDPNGQLVYFHGLGIDIIKLNRAMEIVQRERDLLQTIMNSAGKSQLVYLDRDFNFVLVNEAYATGCGYRPEQMIGKNHFTLYPNPEIEAIFSHVRDTGEDFEIHDNPFVYPDQLERGVTYWDWTLKAIKDPDGQITGLVFSLHETTERKRAEDALKNSEEQYRTLINNMQDAIFRADLDGNIIFTSPSAARILGCSSVEEMIGLNIGKDFSYFPEELEKQMQTLLERGTLTQFEVILKRRDTGEPVTVSANVQFSRNKEGNITGIEGVYSDISERKRVEEALRKSEAKYRFLYKSMRDALVHVDLDGKIIEHNETFVEMLGYTHAELISLTYNDITPDKWHSVEADIIEIILQKGYSGVYEKEYRKKDGTVFPVELRSYLLRDESGNPSGIWAIVRDITERKQVEEHREKLIIELQQAMKNVKTLSGLLPICASCKKIRDDRGYWNQLESYIRDHSEAEFSHGICPDCLKKLYPEIYEGKQKDNKS